MDRSIEIAVNGRRYAFAVDARRSLLDVIRSDLGITSPKYGCGLAQCGACMVLVDGAPARSCVLRAAKVDGAVITTLEGLADASTGALHPVQRGFIEAAGAQCGYCLNGMLMSALALLSANPDPREDDVRSALRHNLCRCGTHKEIVASVMRAAELMREVAGSAATGDSAAALPQDGEGPSA
ncbi:(2Fe-2S)-binding protein [Aurantimonas endophytica]|uniref:Nicotinate dehydrogenase subunit A n=1 Tax=Aurantimonas endophytica TaxID=1522175 RepID=A0A7W6MR79_9HYPH|nr:(2Fe-2S)-binding protein [Aurantimonas endophytica]MBB4004772.1 nicotinate dehydrogenase subunit A [Aurantimonas endophytica]MCO6405584.1 2Fe-2S iron-sulfur cluster binding domain-containing protein [Aurantimonas endophytica]